MSLGSIQVFKVNPINFQWKFFMRNSSKILCQTLESHEEGDTTIRGNASVNSKCDGSVPSQWSSQCQVGLNDWNAFNDLQRSESIWRQSKRAIMQTEWRCPLSTSLASALHSSHSIGAFAHQLISFSELICPWIIDAFLHKFFSNRDNVEYDPMKISERH